MTDKSGEREKIKAELWEALECSSEDWADDLQDELDASDDYREWSAVPDLAGWELLSLDRVGDFAVAHVEIHILMIHETDELSGQLARGFELAAILERSGDGWSVTSLEPVRTT